MLRFLPALATAIFVVGQTAQAEVISISSAAFNRFEPKGGVDDPTMLNGTLQPAGFTYLYAPVQFPKSGDKVCRLSLVSADANGGEKISAKLLRRAITVGGDHLAAPLTMATAASAGSAGTVQRSSTTAVSSRTINNSQNFYFVQVVAENFNTELLGVQIEVKGTCP
jgi:hypothetical protein